MTKVDKIEQLKSLAEGDLIQVNVNILQGNNNYREFIKKEIAGLAKNIAEYGLIQNIKIHSSGRIIVGHRRVAAYKYLLQKNKNYKYIEAQVTHKDMGVEIQLSENIQREESHYTDDYKAVKKLQEDGKNFTQISIITGLSMTNTKKLLDLDKLSEDTMQYCNKQQMPRNLAMLLTQYSHNEQKLIVDNNKNKNGQYYFEPIEKIKKWIKQNILFDLSKAAFDTKKKFGILNTSCDNCPYNSSKNKLLFDDIKTDGRCSHKECYDDKFMSTVYQTNKKYLDLIGDADPLYLFDDIAIHYKTQCLGTFEKMEKLEEHTTTADLPEKKQYTSDKRKALLITNTKIQIIDVHENVNIILNEEEFELHKANLVEEKIKEVKTDHYMKFLEHTEGLLLYANNHVKKLDLPSMISKGNSELIKAVFTFAIVKNCLADTATYNYKDIIKYILIKDSGAVHGNLHMRQLLAQSFDLKKIAADDESLFVLTEPEEKRMFLSGILMHLFDHNIELFAEILGKTMPDILTPLITDTTLVPLCNGLSEGDPKFESSLPKAIASYTSKFEKDLKKEITAINKLEYKKARALPAAMYHEEEE